MKGTLKKLGKVNFLTCEDRKVSCCKLRISFVLWCFFCSSSGLYISSWIALDLTNNCSFGLLACTTSSSSL